VTFIRTIPRSEAEGPVKQMYQEIATRVGYFPNWVQAFSLRPEVWRGWDALLAAIRPNLPVRTYELATLAAARALRSTYCCMAHGRVLADQILDPPSVASIMKDHGTVALEPRERAMMGFATKVVVSPECIGADDLDELRTHGFSDTEIFDIAAAAAARCFFAKLLDALGVQADARFQELDPALLDSLTVGRPIADPRDGEVESGGVTPRRDGRSSRRSGRRQAR
jgi:uncharacterized peroxidase-related enzyme